MAPPPSSLSLRVKIDLKNLMQRSLEHGSWTSSPKLLRLGNSPRRPRAPDQALRQRESPPQASALNMSQAIQMVRVGWSIDQEVHYYLIDAQI